MLVDEVAVEEVVVEEVVVVAEEEQKITITMEMSWKVVDTNTDVDCLHLDCCFHSSCFAVDAASMLEA